MTMLMASRPFRRDTEDYPVRDRHAVYSDAAGLTYTVGANVTSVAFTTTNNGGDLQVTLPAMGKAIGKIYTFRFATKDTTNVDILDAGDDEGLANPVTMDAAGEVMVFWTDGLRWHTYDASATAAT